MKKSIIIIITLIFSSLRLSFCQTSALEIIGKIETPDGMAISGATAEIYDGNTKIKSVNSGIDGELTFTLDYGKTYKVYISKDGLIKKRLDFETNIPTEEQRKLVKEFAMTLVESCEGANMSIFEEPVDKIKYDSEIRNFASDRAYYEQMQSRIAAAYQDLERCKQKKLQEIKSAAEQASKQGNYEEAIKQYEEALKLYPDDANIKRQISQAQKNIDQRGTTQAKYDQLIKEADQFMAQNQLAEAKQKYFDASRINTNETYPQEKIKEIDNVLASQAEQVKEQQATTSKYNDLMAQANTAMAEKNYPLAKQLYEQASQLMPNETIATQRAAEAQKTMEKSEQDKIAREANDKAYQDAMTQGQLALEKGDFASAQRFYETAMGTKPDEALPRQKVSEMQTLQKQKKESELKAQQEEVTRQFNEAVQKADGLLAQKEYDQAIDAYKSALEIVPSDAYTQSQIIRAKNQKVEDLKKQQTEIEKTYADAMVLGDSSKLNQEFDKALIAYQQALKAKPEDPTAQAKVKEAQKLIDAKQLKAKEEQEAKTRYDQLIQEGDGLFQAQKYDEAKTKYKEAQGIYATQSYPANQILAIDNLLTKSKTEAEYNEAIAEADRLFEQKDYNVAKTKYNTASLIIPEKTYPKEKISEINKLLDDIAKKTIQDQYDQIALKAEEAVKQENYEEAKTFYNQAIKVMPDNPYPTKRINEINNLIIDKAQKETQAKYDALFQQANTETDKENFEEAIKLYKQAMIVMPDKPEPQKKINDINVLITNKAKKEIEDQYNVLAAEAEQQVTQENYTEAKTLYNKAMIVMPDNPYPSQRINEINNLIIDKEQKETKAKYDSLVQLADAETSKENFEDAIKLYKQAMVVMPQNQESQKKINDINVLITNKAKKEIEDQYNALAAEAEQQVTQENYAEAKTLYNKAMIVMPDNPYPSQRINEINNLIIDKEQKETKAKYDSLVQLADAETSKENFEDAIKLYKQAMVVMPQNQESQKKINDINVLITNKAKKEIEDQYNALVQQADAEASKENFGEAIKLYKQAMVVMPDNSELQNKINDINELISEKIKKETEDKYKALAAEAEQQVTQENYAEAKTLYNKAMLVMPDNPYPTQRINEINNLIIDKAQKATQTKYDSLVQLADVETSKENFEDAIKLYKQAMLVMPQNQESQKKINDINVLISNKAKKETEDKYNALVQQADAEASKENYDEAIKLYKQAMVVIPDNPEPQNKINDIKELISQKIKKDTEEKYNALAAEAEQQVTQKNYNEAIALYKQTMLVMPENPYPQKRINEIKELIDNLAKTNTDEKYNQLIAEADGYFKQQQFDMAKTTYNKAQIENPQKTYPAQKIFEINQILANLSKKETEDKYKLAVNEGDKLLSEQKYDDAKISYREALKIMPEQVYPQQKINEINSKLTNTAATENEKTTRKNQYDKTIVLADKYFNDQNYPLARTEYSNALAMYPEESYPSSQISKIDQLVTELKQKENQRVEQEKRVATLITRADESFKNKMFIDAKQIYLLVLEINPTHPHAISQIQRIEDMLALQAAEKQKIAETNSKYNSIIAEADSKFNANSLAEARKLYYASLELKPNEEYPKAQIRRIDEKVKLTAITQPNVKPTQTTITQSTATQSSTDVSTSKLDEFAFKTESERVKHLTELKNTYQPGVTLEIYKEKNRTVNRYIVIRGTEVHEVREVIYSYGMTQCYIDGKPTTSMYLQSIVKPKQGENFSKSEK